MINSVVVTSEFRFITCANGFIWTDGQYDNEFWQRYLDVFSHVYIVARTSFVNEPEDNWKRVDCEQVKLLPLPHYIGPFGMLKNIFKIRRGLKKVSTMNASFILRVPSIIGTFLFKELENCSKKYAVEVVGDPEEVFSKRSSMHILRSLFKWYFSKALKLQVAKACGASYVTKRTLQEKYPVNVSSFTTHYSSIQLPESFFEFPIERTFSKIRKLLFIGSLEQRYKGLHVLLSALATYKKQGGTFVLNIIGEGREIDEYKAQSEALGLSAEVFFIGAVSTMHEIGQHFLDSDLFILPSLTEGLPRVVIESMACGVPCIATRVGGIPELLPRDCLVDANDDKQLADKIRDFLSKPDKMYSFARLNRKNAQEYKSSELVSRRKEFYINLRSNTTTIG